jgi:endonuclease/exonuclease/phosphatase family metal-dependent hydrolase
MPKLLRRLIRFLLFLIVVAVVAVAGLLAWLSIAEYRPADVESVAVSVGAKHDTAQTGKLYKIVTLNVGYGALDRTQDFFMDGGTHVRPDQKTEVEDNLSGLLSALSLQNADICLLQETDVSSRRSYWINETDYFTRGLSMGSAFAYNFRCPFIPYPWPPIGKVESGITTLNNLAVTSATRESLPVPFNWPVRVANLKRCLLVERLPVLGSQKELVLVNLHLEAYSSDAGRKAQMEQLSDLLTTELAKGNYVLAGGDFNQDFPGAMEKYPLPENPSWVPGLLTDDDIPAGFSYAYDMSVPTCRALDKAYDGDRESLTAYVIDGFIVSSNIKVNSVETMDLNFRNTDHQPVAMEFTLQ